MNEHLKGLFCIILSALLFGSMGVLVRMISIEVTPLSQVLIRVIFAFLILSPFAWRLRSDLFRIRRVDLPYFIIAGCAGYALMLIFFTLAILNTTIAKTFFLLFTEPIFVAILAFFFLREKISQTLAIAIAISLAGIFLIFNPLSMDGSLQGDLYALGAGFFYALYILVSRKLGERYAPVTTTIWTFVFALILIAPIVFYFEEPLSLSISHLTWLLLALFGGVNVGAYFLLNAGISRLPANYVGVLLILEPVFAVGYGFLFFAEVPSLTTVIGSILIIITLLHMSIVKMKTQLNS